METMVLLVFLAIVWAGVGVYWLRTRMPSPSISLGGYSRRLSTLGAMQTRRPAPVVPLRAVGQLPGSVTSLASRRPAGPPGHSLTEPANRPVQGRPAGITSETARVRRRNVLMGLAGFAAVTLVGIFAVGGTGMILLHLVADAMLLGFVMLLVQYQREIELDRTKARPVIAAPRTHQLVATGTDGR